MTFADVPKEQRDEILRLQDVLDEEENGRGRVYDKYGSPGEALIPVIGEVAELCKGNQPTAVLNLLKEFLS